MMLGNGLAYAQQVPTIDNPSNGGVNDVNYWSRVGNNNNPNGGNGNNIFGTRWNSPIYFITGGLAANTYRMKLNGPMSVIPQYAINGYSWPSVNTTGYLLLGDNNTSMSGGGSIYSNMGAFSQLHLNGIGSEFQEFGYRPWMKTGLTLTSNRDMAYIGHRKLSTDPNEEDITELSISWSDNETEFGPDDMVFRFIGYGAGTTVSTNMAINNDLDGLHIARFTPDGMFALGNTFGINATGMNVGYVRPQSLLHMSLDGNRPVWSQYTNQSIGQAVSDGLRIGISGGNSYIYNQENSHLLFSTNASTATQLGNERMRLTHIGAPGIPSTAGANSTRLAVSLNPSAPLTAPRSLVHIGGPLSGQNTDGVRDWMNVGYLATFNSDNMYVGLKEEGDDRQDAVIAWGDNQTDFLDHGPDNLRFIFAASQYALSPGTPAAKSANGQEVARFTPACATCPVNTASLGIGDYTPASGNGPTTIGYVGATLDVNGDARIRTVTQNDNLTQVLMRDPNDLGRIHWKDINTFSVGGNAYNGLSVDTGYIQLGNVCGDVNQPAKLYSDREIPMRKFNIIFSGQHNDGARIGIGTDCDPGGKLEVKQEQGLNEISILGINTAPIAWGPGDTDFGVAVMGLIETGDGSSCEATSIGGMFVSKSSAFNAGVVGIAAGNNDLGCNTENHGGHFVADNGSSNNIGIYAEAPIGTGNWAAWINGDGFITTPWTISDAQLKREVTPMQEATSSLMQLNPVSYSFDQGISPTMNLPEGRQFGILAQELQEVYPNLVKKTHVPRELTLNGEQQEQGLSDVSVVNYNGLIPVLIAAFQEQNERINQLEAQLNECCSRPKNREALDNEIPQQTGAVIQTRLEDIDNVYLGQNIPNPFEAATRIPAYIPQNIRKAEITFYGNDGKTLQVLSVNDRGTVLVEVDASTLAAGVYSYTLFVDGKPVDTKRMIKR